MMPGKVTVLKHPVINSRLVDLRQTRTSPKEFRQVRNRFILRHTHSTSMRRTCPGGDFLVVPFVPWIACESHITLGDP
jgi:hypothetical protein